MKLISASPLLISLIQNVISQNTNSELDHNAQIAENAIRDWCYMQDPQSLTYINRDNSVCTEHFPGSRSGTNGTLSISARKLKQLKMLVLWLQPEHRFARYCYYGCWCLPDEDHAEYVPRYGKPVDEVDQSCKKQSQCYECAKMNYGEDCESSDIGYKYELHNDPTDPTNHWKNTIVCKDNPNKKGCKRSLCECDKKLAEDLRTNFGFWKEGHHQRQGGFDTSMCEADHNGNGGRGPLACCGKDDGPKYPFRTMNGARKCCGSKTYDSTIQECCSDDDVRFLGAC